MSELKITRIRTVLRRITNTIDSISRWSGEIFMWLALVLILMFAVVVVARYVFHHPIVQIAESTMFVGGGFFVLSGAYTHFRRQHVNMDLVRRYLNLRTGAIVDSITALLFFAYVSALLWQGWEIFLRAFIEKQKMQSMWWPVLWPVYSTIPIGAALLLLQGISKFIRDIYISVTGREL